MCLQLSDIDSVALLNYAYPCYANIIPTTTNRKPTHDKQTTYNYQPNSVSFENAVMTGAT